MIKVIFLGDICLNDDYNSLYKNGQNPFSELKNTLEQADLVVGNLECFARGNEGGNPLRSYILSADLATLNYLNYLHVSLVGLANNHVYDNLDDGFQKTIDFLEQNGISYIGASLRGQESLPFIFKKNGTKICILNYVTKDTNPRRPSNSKVELNWFSLEKARTEICELRNIVDYVIVFAHWGGRMEGAMYPDPSLRNIAHALVDYGADLIVGHHSHTLQPFEIYKDKHIFYSLGNFCFSDIYKNGIKGESDHKRTGHSILLVVDFDNKQYGVSSVGIYENNNQIMLQNDETVKLREFKNSRPFIHAPGIWFLYYFYEMNIYKVKRHFFANERNPFKQISKIKPERLKKALRNLRETFNPTHKS